MSNRASEPLDDLERQIYELLCETFHREECAAKAVARLEHDIVKQYQAEMAAPSKASGEGEEEIIEEAEYASSRDFSSDEFQAMFTNINTLRLVGELVQLLGVPQLGPEILSTLIAESFRPRAAGPSVGGRSKVGGEETLIGNDLEMAFHELRRRAEQSQRTARRGG